MPWDFKDGLPIYMQIVSRIQLDIASGVYKSGEKMPSVRELALVAGVNPNTMQRALTELESEGLLYSERTSGRFVTQEENVLKEMKKNLASTYIRELFHHLEYLGMTKEEIIEAVKEWEGEEA